MNIVYSASNLYAPLAGISMTSLFLNNVDAPEITVVILDNRIGAENKEKLQETAKKFGRELRFVPLAEVVQKVSLDMKRWNISTFGRLFEASSLPDMDKVIHIDCDTIVDGSLQPLWETDIENAVLAASPDCISDGYKTNIGMRPEELYIQAGVILLNLKRIRKLHLEDTFTAYLEKYGEHLSFVDQEIINACVPAEEKRELPLRYNSYSLLHYLTYEQVRQFKRVTHMVTKENFKDSLDHGVIYHFTWCALEGTRPWIEGDDHPKKERFLWYRSQSAWADMAPWQDTRKKSKRYVTALVKRIPKGILAPMVGVVHGKILPWRNQRKRKKMTIERR